MSPLSSSPAAQLILIALASASLSASAIFSFQFANRRYRRNVAKKDLFARDDCLDHGLDRGLDDAAISLNLYPAGAGRHEEEELTREQLSRTTFFLTPPGMQRLTSAYVVVVGVGGVGSAAATALLRNGVTHLRIIDFDQLTLSSLNRHACAIRADVGRAKVDVLREYLLRIMPEAKIDARRGMFRADTADDLLDGHIDYVLDCIDDISTKSLLIKYCVRRGIPIVSSMGAGAKADASRIQIADISNTHECALARAVRRELRLAGITSGVTVVYSTEKPGAARLLPLDDARVQDAGEFAPAPNFRARILPVLGPIPTMFGLALATHVLTAIAATVKVRPMPIKLRPALYEKMHRDLAVRERKAFGLEDGTGIGMSVADAGYVLDELFLGKSVVSGSMDKLVLVRWDVTKPVAVDNCAVMTRAEADRHARVVADEGYSKDVLQRMQDIQDEQQRLERWRTALVL